MNPTYSYLVVRHSCPATGRWYLITQCAGSILFPPVHKYLAEREIAGGCCEVGYVCCGSRNNSQFEAHKGRNILDIDCMASPSPDHTNTTCTALSMELNVCCGQSVSDLQHHDGMAGSLTCVCQLDRLIKKHAQSSQIISIWDGSGITTDRGSLIVSLHSDSCEN